MIKNSNRSALPGAAALSQISLYQFIFELWVLVAVEFLLISGNSWSGDSSINPIPGQDLEIDTAFGWSAKSEMVRIKGPDKTQTITFSVHLFIFETAKNGILEIAWNAINVCRKCSHPNGSADTYNRWSGYLLKTIQWSALKMLSQTNLDDPICSFYLRIFGYRFRDRIVAAQIRNCTRFVGSIQTSIVERFSVLSEYFGIKCFCFCFWIVCKWNGMGNKVPCILMHILPTSLTEQK